MSKTLITPSRLDGSGRCCGRKPIRYKRDGGPHFFCPRCDRSFHLVTGLQIENWAYRRVDGGFELTYDTMMSMALATIQRSATDA